MLEKVGQQLLIMLLQCLDTLFNELQYNLIRSKIKRKSRYLLTWTFKPFPLLISIGPQSGDCARHH